MKVLSIREQHRQKDDKLYYKIAIDGSPYPLILYDMPPFAEGYDIPRDSLVLKGDLWDLKVCGEISDKDASIREQTAIKIVADLFAADKLKELRESEDYLITSLRQWIDRALIQGPLMQKTLEVQRGDNQ